MAKTKKLSGGVVAFLVIIFSAIGFIAGFFGYGVYQASNPLKGDVYYSGGLSMHFLELGNGYSGDCIYIKAGDVDILVDAGSRTNSVATIKNYVDTYCTDGILEYVIVTHADRDHIACFAGDKSNKSLFDYYKCKTIIDFSKTNSSTEIYGRYIEKRDAEVAADGAVHYTALECWKEQNGAKKSYELTNTITLNILYNYYYENKSIDENNYSVCFMLTQGDSNFLFTGDLEVDGESRLVDNNDLPEVELFKAGHHGSNTSSTDKLLKVIKPKIVCVCCCAGSVEYTQNLPNTFPTQNFINRVAPYTDKVYVTTTIKTVYDDEKGKYVDSGEYKLMNGNIVVTVKTSGVSVSCSNNNIVLKDTEWFKENRECPKEWKSAA